MRSQAIFVSLAFPFIVAACGGQNQLINQPGAPSDRAAAISSPAWSVTPLGTFNDDEQSVATGINNRGQIVGYSLQEGSLFHRPFVYANGRMQAMLTPLREESIQPTQINNNGIVSGYTYQPQARDGGGPFIHSEGNYARLGGGDAPSGLNDEGKAVGNMVMTSYDPERTDGSPFITRRYAYLYSAGVITDLTAELGVRYAYGINTQGEIVGGMPDGKAYVYRNGQVIGLGALPRDSSSLALSINIRGDIVGVSANQDDLDGFSMRTGVNPSSGWRAFLYQNGMMTDLNAAGGFTMSHAFLINSQGHVLGEAWKDGYRFSYLYRDGRFINLSDLPELMAAGWSRVRIYGMNDSGQLVGKGTINGKERALLLDPVAAG